MEETGVGGTPPGDGQERWTASVRRNDRGLPARDDHHCNDELLDFDLDSTSRARSQRGEHASGGAGGIRSASRPPSSSYTYLPSSAPACATRVTLSWEDDTRVAYLYKSPRLPQGRARYTVTTGGVRDVRGVKRPSAG